MNDPVRFSDPTGHRNCDEDGYNCERPSSCGSDAECGTARDTFVKAGIKLESPTGYNERPRALRKDRFTGLGLAKISDAEMETEYGELVDKDHQKIGLGLRQGPCVRFGKCLDQEDPDVAVIGMRTRLTLRLDVCSQHSCTGTDMFMVSLLAADERMTPKTLEQGFKNYKSSNEATKLDWAAFMAANWTSSDDRDKNKQLINRFSENVKSLEAQGYYAPPIDWSYVSGLLP